MVQVNYKRLTFAESGVNYVDFLLDTEELRSALSSLADEAGSVALINEDHGVVLLGEIDDLRERSDISVHREDTISNDEPVRASSGLEQQLLEIFHVHVLISQSLGLAQSDAVND